MVGGNLANRYSDLGRVTEARQQYETAITLHKQNANKEAECRDTYNLANLLSDLGDAKARSASPPE